MAGNVCEWVNDWLFSDSYYSSLPGSSLEGPATGSLRVVRGGSWNGFPREVLVAALAGAHPGASGFEIGFRCVRSD